MHRMFEDVLADKLIKTKPCVLKKGASTRR
jgi:hypothetical protein